VAYSVDGSPPQVVVSEGFEARVGADMAAFVIDHERAHLRRRDRRLLVVSALVDATFGFVPMVRRSALALMLAVERAADEAAAGPDRHRRHRLAAAMRDLAAAGSRSMPVEAVTYRAAGLASPPRASRPELLAVAGLVALGLAVVGTALHIGIEAPAVVACLR
jgi:beta-lactamase regulating signal transducer with metallopeptidase domain